jgi:hypothetical protein
MVTQAQAMMAKMKPVIQQSLQQGMGAPGDIFASQPEAIAWISEKLEKSASSSMPTTEENV